MDKINIYENNNIIYIITNLKIIEYKRHSILNNKLEEDIEELFSNAYENLFKKYIFNSNIFLFYLIKYLDKNLNKKIEFNNKEELIRDIFKK